MLLFSAARFISFFKSLWTFLTITSYTVSRIPIVARTIERTEGIAASCVGVTVVGIRRTFINVYHKDLKETKDAVIPRCQQTGESVMTGTKGG